MVLNPDISKCLGLRKRGNRYAEGIAPTVGDRDKTHLYQVVICQENPFQNRTGSGPDQVNLIAESQGMIVEQRDKPSNFIEGRKSAITSTVFCFRRRWRPTAEIPCGGRDMRSADSCMYHNRWKRYHKRWRRNGRHDIAAHLTQREYRRGPKLGPKVYTKS